MAPSANAVWRGVVLPLAVVIIAGTVASQAALSPTVTGSTAHDLGTTELRSMVIGAGVLEPSGPPSQLQSPAESEFSTDTKRVGGSDPAPTPGKPGWVWWVAGAFMVMLGAGVFRMWRHGAFGAIGTTDEADEADAS
jgi:hypothetical protein